MDAALEDLRSRFDVVLCEGVGAAAELNQADADIVNLGLAARAGIPAVVVGDVERGGVVAALYGTVLLLPDEQRRWVRGFVVNKLRGDPSLVTEDAAELERRCGIPTLGIIPFAEGLSIDTEDAMALARGGPGTVLDQGATGEPADPSPDGRDRLDVAVVRLPHISGFTDVDALGVEPDVSVRFVDQVSSLGEPDLIVLPGTKATVADLEWFRAEGYERALSDLRAGDDGPFVLGICGGYQMLGGRIDDPGGVESSSGTVNGLGLLDLRTVFLVDRRTRQRRGRTNWRQVPLSSDAGRLPDSELEGAPRQSPSLTVTGYEIHHGRTYPGEGTTPWLLLGDGRGRRGEGIVDDDAGIVGSNLHGLLENDDLRSTLLGAVAARRHKRWVPSGVSFATAREGQIDRLADLCRQHLDTTALWQLIVEGGGTQQRPEAATRT